MQQAKTKARGLWLIAALMAWGCSGGFLTTGDGGEDPGGDEQVVEVTDPEAVEDPGADEEPEAAAPTRWSKTYGGREIDFGMSMTQTSDGCYVVAGYSASFGDGVLYGWLLKLDDRGNVLWEYTLGGSGSNSLSDVIETREGDLVVAGRMFDVEIFLAHAAVFRLDSDGRILWQKKYEDPDGNATFLESVAEAPDDGFIVVGSIDMPTSDGMDEMWVARLDGNGAVEWQRSYGAAGHDGGQVIEPAPGGGYILAGNSNSFGDGRLKAWVMRLDDAGDIVWQNLFGETGYHLVSSLRAVQGGGFVLAGSADPEDISHALWVMKIDEEGVSQWEKRYLFEGSSSRGSAEPCPDGGYVVAGEIHDPETYDQDLWVLRLDDDGQVLWQKIFGSRGPDEATRARQTEDGGFFVTGTCGSYGTGTGDVWAMMLGPDGTIGDDCPEGMQRDSSVAASAFTSIPVATTAVPRDTACVAVDAGASLASTTAEVHVQCSH